MYGLSGDDTPIAFLFLLEQDVMRGHDTYSDCVVCARTMDEAKRTHPDGSRMCDGYTTYSWPSDPAQVKATLIGLATAPMAKYIEVQGGAFVLCASFHAG